MRRWYSKRGARRGLLLAIFAAALWASWAIGYVYGDRPLATSISNPGSPSNPETARHRRVEL